MQKLRTSVMKKTVNPVWNEDLTLAVMDASVPIKLVSIVHLFDHLTLMIDNLGFWTLCTAWWSSRSCLISEIKKKQEVFGKDTFSKDDRMGDAEFDIEALVQIIQMVRWTWRTSAAAPSSAPCAPVARTAASPTRATSSGTTARSCRTSSSSGMD
jgi:hypothetical protein